MRKIQKTALVGGTVATLMVGGVAFAAWTSTGTGTGDVTAGEAVNLGVSGATIGDLFPSNDVTQTVTVTNPNPYPVTLSSIQYISTAVDSAHSGCNVSSVTAADTPDTSVVAAKTGGVDGSADVDVVVSMDNTAYDACQGATFTITYTAHGQSS
jgi:hypothetical protein